MRKNTETSNRNGYTNENRRPTFIDENYEENQKKAFSIISWTGGLYIIELTIMAATSVYLYHWYTEQPLVLSLSRNDAIVGGAIVGIIIAGFVLSKLYSYCTSNEQENNNERNQNDDEYSEADYVPSGRNRTDRNDSATLEHQRGMDNSGTFVDSYNNHQLKNRDNFLNS
jgi:hypothetical protein